jgi:hypothetical protein
MTERSSPLPLRSTDVSVNELPRADDLVATLLTLPGMHTRALHALLTVAEIAWSTKITTACVSCAERSRLLLNPDFVGRYCGTPERLGMLVLHELSHVMLGHTRLFPRPTPLHNIAFDAVVNRSVLSMLQETGAPMHRYAALLEEVYEPDRAPAFLLRPPPGWPARPDWNASRKNPDALRAIHRQLYGEGTAALPSMLGVTYGEIMEALRGNVSVEAAGRATLLGAHGTTPAEAGMLDGTRDADLVASMPAVFETLQGELPGAGAGLTRERVADATRNRAIERQLRALILGATQSHGNAATRVTYREREVVVPMRWQDRRASCRVALARALGAPVPLLFAGQVTTPRRRRVGVTIYVDVSGSMWQLLPRLRRSLWALRHEVRPSVFWFSDQVVPAGACDIEDGAVLTSGGTSISAVLEHVMQTQPQGQPVVVLTDGYLEQVSGPLVTKAVRWGARAHLGVVGGGPLWERAPWVERGVRVG